MHHSHSGASLISHLQSTMQYWSTCSSAAYLGAMLEGVQNAGALGMGGAAVDVWPPQRLGILRQRKDVIAEHNDLVSPCLRHTYK